MKSPILSFILLCAISFSISAQTCRADLKTSMLSINGTSSLHDWESVAHDFTFSVLLDSNKLKGLKGTILVRSIKSGKGIMDDKTYAAMEAEKYPEIRLIGEDLTIQNGKVMGKGTLTIHNVAKPIVIQADFVKTTGGFTVKGNVALKMTDFGIDPPTAMFGSLVTGNDVVIAYAIVMNTMNL